MSILLLTDEARALADEVIAYAENHRFSLVQLQELMETNQCACDDPHFACIIPLDFRCVYSVEQQPFGLCKHLSVSVSRPGRMPHPVALEELMKLFGFVGGLQQADSLFFEGMGHKSINIVQRYEQ